MITSVQEAPAELPRLLALERNYPNPFGFSSTSHSPATRITYGISDDGMVVLRVYDVHGRVVSTLVHEVKSAGAYAVDFDGSRLPGGVYLYRLEMRGRSGAGRMILVK